MVGVMSRMFLLLTALAPADSAMSGAFHVGGGPRPRSKTAFLAGGDSLDIGALDEATASAEAIAAAAEKEAAQKETQDRNEKVPASDGDDDSSSEDENDYEEGKDTTDGKRATNESVPVSTSPPLAEQSSSPCPGEVLESVSLQGRIARIRKMLQDNLHRQAELAAVMNKTAFENRVDADANAVVEQTGWAALSKFLGTMRKEMWQFASPFYLQHAVVEQRELKDAQVKLEAALQDAEAALSDPPAKVMESRLR